MLETDARLRPFPRENLRRNDDVCMAGSQKLKVGQDVVLQVSENN